MSRFSQNCSCIFRWALRIVGKPGQENLFLLTEYGDQEALAVGRRVVPGVVDPRVDRESFLDRIAVAEQVNAAALAGQIDIAVLVQAEFEPVMTVTIYPRKS